MLHKYYATPKSHYLCNIKMREEQPLPCVPRMVHVRLLNSFYFLQAATSDNLSTSYTDKTNIHSDFSFVNIYNSNMNDCKELTYEQVRELAIARYVDDNKISIGVWAKQNGYIKKKRQKDNRVYTIYIKMNNDNAIKQ